MTGVVRHRKGLCLRSDDPAHDEMVGPCVGVSRQSLTHLGEQCTGASGGLALLQRIPWSLTCVDGLGKAQDVYEELLSVKGVVDLSPPRALHKAQNFLTLQGYVIVSQTATTFTVERRGEEHALGVSGAPRLVVMAVPQPEGGVKIKVVGTDLERVRERQGLWALWAEGLPARGPVPNRRIKVVAAKGVRGGLWRSLRSGIRGLFTQGVLLVVAALSMLLRR